MAINVQYNKEKGYFEVSGTVLPSEFGALKDRDSTIPFGGKDVKLEGKKRSFYQVAHIKGLNIPSLNPAGGPIVNTRIAFTLTATGFTQPDTPESIQARKAQQTMTRAKNAIASLSPLDKLRLAFPNASEAELADMVETLEGAE
jgi:hypothetical protein